MERYAANRRAAVPGQDVPDTGEHVSPSERSCGAAAHVASLVWGNVVPVFGSLAVTLHYVLAFGYVFVCLGFGAALLAAAAVFETVSTVRAARRAKAGEYYRYRMCLEFVKDGTGK